MHMTDKVRGFNQRGVPRRMWQSGAAGSSYRFWFKVPMFLRLKHGEKKPPFPSHLHADVRAAERKSRSYRANPARPVLMAVEDGKLKMLSECTPNHLVPGDVLAISFNACYVEAEKYWYPQFMPVEMVRVRGSGSTHGLDRDVVAVAATERATLKVGEVVDGTQ